MKDFNRTNLSFSLYGLNCELCSMRLDGYCPGCGGGAGNQSCAIVLFDFIDISSLRADDYGPDAYMIK